MLERIFGKKEPATAPDVTMSFEIPEDIKNKIDNSDGSTGKVVFLAHLKTLNRVQLLCVEDDPWFKDHEEHDWLWEAYNEDEWARMWPMGKYQYEDSIPNIVMDTIPIQGLDKKKPINLGQLVKQVEGMQKKLDKVLKIVESNEITMSVKTALSL